MFMMVMLLLLLLLINFMMMMMMKMMILMVMMMIMMMFCACVCVCVFQNFTWWFFHVFSACSGAIGLGFLLKQQSPSQDTRDLKSLSILCDLLWDFKGY